MAITVSSPPGTRRRHRLAPWPLAATVLAGQAMASLDTSIVNVGGPRIQQDLRLSAAGLELAVYAYVLVYAVGLIVGARLGARHGFGRVFVIGTATFTASSLACGLAVTPSMLVGARAVQGLGAALLVPQVLSLLQTSFDGHSRRRALSLYGMVLAAGVAVGQVLGGALISADILGSGWRPIFLVNVPVGVTVFALAAGRLPAPGPVPPAAAAAGSSAERASLDMPGALLLAAAVGGLVLPVTFGSAAGWPAWCWPVLATGMIMLGWFGVREGRAARSGKQPLIDPGLLARPGVGAGLAGVFTLMGCYGGLLFTTALYLQHSLHESPLRSGLTFAAYATGFAAASLSWSRLPGSWRPRVPAYGFAAVASATGLLAWVTGHGGWPFAATILLACAGAGHGAGFGALVQRTVAATPGQHAAAFSGVLATVNQLAIVIGIAAAGALFQTASPSASVPPFSLTLMALAAAAALAGAAVSAARRGGS